MNHVETALRIAKAGNGSEQAKLAQRMANPHVRAALDTDYRVNSSYDIPYVAGISSNLRTLYVHHLFPLHALPIGRQNHNVERFLWLHECLEAMFMRLWGDTYDSAHRLATMAERAAVMKAGIDWKAYSDVFKRYAKFLRNQPIRRVPKNLLMAPYHESGERGLVEQMHRAMR